MSSNHEECKGCKAYLNEEVVCTMEPFYVIKGKKIYCPCLTCIVKGMCMRGCDLSVNYVMLFLCPDITSVLEGE